MVASVVMLGIALALGLLALLRAFQGRPLLPQLILDVVRRRTSRTSRTSPADQRVYVMAAVVFVAALLVTRNFVLAVIAGACVGLHRLFRRNHWL